ncbi:MAG: ABC transporter substrate-binding protein [Endomicrobium sp.]|jgi:NitT/TauT family transport system substrate-binding protein|nr:ABC transporter substrate-binding protein [Endomicrobium sp.]
MKNIAKLFAVVVSVVIAASSLSIAADKKKYPLGEVEIPTLNGAVCTAAAYIAYEKGLFEEEGVKVTLTSGLSFELTRTLLASGKAPVIHGDFQFFPAVYNGVPVKLIGGIHYGCIKVLLPKNSDIKTAADLKGKTIGVDEIGGTPMSVVSVILGNAGLNPQTDVVWKPYPNDQLVTAAQKGEVDVVAAWDPFATLLSRQGFTVFSDIAEDKLFAGKFCCFLFASSKVLKENPAQIAALLRGYYKGAQYIANNTKEAAQIIVDKKYVGTDDVALVEELLAHYKYPAHHEPGFNAKAKDDAVYFAKELTKTGYLPKDLDAQKFIDGIYSDLFETDKKDNKEHKTH